MTQQAHDYFKATGHSPVISAEYVAPEADEKLPDENPRLTPEQRLYEKVKRTRVCASCGHDVDRVLSSTFSKTKDRKDVPQNGVVLVCLQVGKPPCGFWIFGGETE